MLSDSNQSPQSSVACIYVIENLANGKKYVGRTVNFKMRVHSHKSDLNLNRHHNKHLQRAWNKYGCDNFLFSVLEVCDSARLSDREIYWIDMLDTYRNGYWR